MKSRHDQTISRSYPEDDPSLPLSDPSASSAQGRARNHTSNIPVFVSQSKFLRLPLRQYGDGPPTQQELKRCAATNPTKYKPYKQQKQPPHKEAGFAFRRSVFVCVFAFLGLFSWFSTRYMKSGCKPGSSERVEGPCRGLLASGSPASAVTAVSAAPLPSPRVGPRYPMPTPGLVSY